MTACNKCGKEAATRRVWIETRHLVGEGYDAYNADLCDSCAKPKKAYRAVGFS